MSVLDKDVALAVRWSTAERVRALKRIVSRKSIEKVCLPSLSKRRHCRRLPRWFVVWFVIALALFCRDSYQQVFRWLQRFRPKGTPGRSTLCEARKSVGVAPLRRLAEAVIELLAQPDTPRTHYAGLRLMALARISHRPQRMDGEAGRAHDARAGVAAKEGADLNASPVEAGDLMWRESFFPSGRGPSAPAVVEGEVPAGSACHSGASCSGRAAQRRARFACTRANNSR